MTNKESIRLFVRKVLYISCNYIISVIPKKKGLVLFTSWLGQKYLDNCKYVYEYFLEKSDYKPVWMTKNVNIYNQLKTNNKPVARFGTLRGAWLQLRAEAVFSSIQFADYNTWLLSRCLYVDLNHGHPIKDPGACALNDTYAYNNYKVIANHVHFFSIVAGSRTKNEYNVVSIPKSHILISDFARNDVFFEESLRKGKNINIEAFKSGRKAIVYMPTQRSAGKKKMDMSLILPLKDIQEYCERHNCVFIIKKHFYHRNEYEDLSSYSNIIDVTSQEDIDPQVLLYQADMLITDYSACYVDYMLLRRPIVFYQYDYSEYINRERSLYYDFNKIQIAPVVYEKDILIPTINDIFTDGDIYLERRMDFAHENYFDNINHDNGRAKVLVLFNNLYKKYIR